MYASSQDGCYCPAVKPLPHRITYSLGKPAERTAYRCLDCRSCKLAAQCLRKSDESGRELIDDVHEPHRRQHRERMQCDESQIAYKRRQHFGELPFAVIKTMFDLRRFLLYGIDRVNQE